MSRTTFPSLDIPVTYGRTFQPSAEREYIRMTAKARVRSLRHNVDEVSCPSDQSRHTDPPCVERRPSVLVSFAILLAVYSRRIIVTGSPDGHAGQGIS